MKHLTATICVTLAVLLGSVGMSWSDDKPYWKLTEILSEHPDKSEYSKRVHIEISVPKKSHRYFVAGWVNLFLGECSGYMVVNGDLTLRKEGNEIGALLTVKNLPLGETAYKENTDELADLPFNQKTIFEDPEKSPIYWVDIDGDGIDELIYESVCGNRFATHHFIYEYDESLSVPQLVNPLEVRFFDPSDIPQTKIETHWSWSACGNRHEIFESINGQYVLSELIISDNETGECLTEEFERRQDGKLCLTRSHVSEWVGELKKWVDKGVKYHSKETCRSAKKL
tara:strand:- start:426 stop:1277 length:852 start_codon:yes stop_codon:yes gene_type:complete